MTRVGARPRAALGLDLRWAVGLFMLAAGMRLAFVIAVTRPTFPHGGTLPFNDMLFYHDTARALADGHGYISFDGQPTGRWPPAFPFLLSLVYRVTGPRPGAGEAMNALLGAMTVPLLYLVALRSFGRSTAKVAGVALAFFPGQILLPEGILAETLYAFVLVGVLALLVILPDRRWAGPALGAAVGVAALTRGEGLVLLLVPPLVWWGSLPRRELALRTGAMLAATLVVVTPWVIRNAVEVHSFVGISTNSAQTFWAGHNEDAYGGASYPRGAFARQVTHLPRKGFEVDQAKLLRKEALKWMVHHPLGELSLIPRKLIYLSVGDSRAIQVGVTNAERQQKLGAPVVAGIAPVVTEDAQAGVLIGTIADIAWYGLLALTALALVVLWRKLWGTPATRASIVVIGSAVVLYGFVFYGNFRYRMPLEPLMILLAAPLVSASWRLRPELRQSRPTS